MSEIAEIKMTSPIYIKIKKKAIKFSKISFHFRKMRMANAFNSGVFYLVLKNHYCSNNGQLSTNTNILSRAKNDKRNSKESFFKTKKNFKKISRMLERNKKISLFLLAK